MLMYIDVCNDCRRRDVVLMGLFANIGLFAVYFCIAFVLLYFKIVCPCTALYLF